jgi:hypothetical protein
VINTEKNLLNGDHIQPSDKNIYVFGHKPILSLNPKEKKNKSRIWDINDYLVYFFNGLGEKIKKITYICADTHNYQDITISFKNGLVVHQTVVGSGGTFKMDDLPTERVARTDPKLTGLNSELKNILVHQAFTGYHGFCIFDSSELGGARIYKMF